LSKAKDIKINTKMRILFFVMFSIFTFGQDQPIDSLKIQNSKYQEVDESIKFKKYLTI
jgi:hypothetical protein